MSDRTHWLLKLRRDAVYLKTDNGIIFRSASADFQLKGASIYDSFTTLLAHLDAAVSQKELLAGIRPDQRSRTGALLDMLVDRDILRRIDPDDVALLDPALARRYRSQIDFLGHFAVDPSRRFARFRAARIAIVGNGAAFTSAGLALLDNGLERLVIATDDRRAMRNPAWDTTYGQLAEAGVPAQIEICAPADIDAGAFDLVLCCGEALDTALLQSLRRLTMADGAAVLPAFVLDGHSYIGPLAEPDRAGCWLCAMMRWSDRAVPASAAVFWRRLALPGSVPHPDPSLAGTTAQMLGNGAALEAFGFFTGVPAVEARGHLLDHNLDTLETARRRFSRHPDCPRCCGLPAEQACSTAAADEKELLARWSPLLGHPFATFDAFEDADFEQLPLSVSVLPVRETRVAGWSLAGVLQARVEALANAVRHRIDSGDWSPPLCSATANLQDSGPTIGLSQVAGWFGAEDEAAAASPFAVGRYVDDGASVLVSAAAISPILDGAPQMNAGRRGLGVGPSAESATDRAVCDLFEQEMVDLLADGRLQLTRYDPRGALADKTIDYLLKSLALLKADPPSILLARHNAGMMAAILHPGRPTIAIGELDIVCDLDPRKAVRGLLARRVAMSQLEQHGHAIPARRRRGAFAHIPLALPTAAPPLPVFEETEATDASRLHARLAEAGIAIVAVDATPIDAVETAALAVIGTLFVSRGAAAAKDRGVEEVERPLFRLGTQWRQEIAAARRTPAM